MPKLRNIIYLLLYIAFTQLMIVGVMHVFDFSYKQAANWVFGVTIALITIGTVRVYIQSKKIQQAFIDMHDQINFSKDNDEMLSQYKSLIERIDNTEEKARLLKEFELIVAIHKSGNEIYKSSSTDPTTIEAMERNLQRLKDAQIGKDTKSS